MYRTTLSVFIIFLTAALAMPAIKNRSDLLNSSAILSPEALSTRDVLPITFNPGEPTDGPFEPCSQLNLGWAGNGNHILDAANTVGDPLVVAPGPCQQVGMYKPVCVGLWVCNYGAIGSLSLQIRGPHVQKFAKIINDFSGTEYCGQLNSTNTANPWGVIAKTGTC